MTCPVCGGEVRQQGPGRPRIYCSDRCVLDARRQRAREARVRQVTECIYCGGPISDDKKVNAVYCSANCRKRHHDTPERRAELAGRTGRCDRCGQRTAPSSDGLCGCCRRQDQRRERERLIVELWNQGLDRLEIAAQVGYTPNSVGSRISQLRAAGEDLPLRRPDMVAKNPAALAERKAAA